MSSIDERITQFENMAMADPTNEMAHFSLGSAYMQAERPAEAAASFEQCITLNPEMSKAYHLCGEAMLAVGWEDRAVAHLNRGYEVAAAKGDRMPQEAIEALLIGVGKPIPEISDAAAASAEIIAASGSFICKRTGTPGSELESPPFKGPIGEWIAGNITAETWDQWIGQGTKVINEMRLDLSRPEDSAMYDEHMNEFLGVPEELR
ncbi:MAG: tetratricopeptide repeat protein [Phycisphaerae bacterium]|nr:tetratricopeptide repeat protein [Phycisphaerae bacterium]